MRLTPLRRKLALGYMGLIAAVMALTGLLVLRYVSEHMIDLITRDLTTRAVLVREASQAEWPWSDNRAGDSLAARIAANAQARVTIVGSDGTVLAESEQASAGMDNHSDRPEVQSALSGVPGQAQRFSDTLTERMLYVALPPTPEMPAMVRLAVSLEWVWERIAAIRTILGSALGGGLLLAALAGWWLGSHLLTRPLSVVVEGARRFAGGDLTNRITVETADEWEVLASALNSMATSLGSQMTSLTAERNRLSKTLEELPDGILLLSSTGFLRLANGRARQWLSLAKPLGDYQFVDSSEQIAAAGSRNAVGLLGRTPELREFVQAALSAATGLQTEITIRTPAPVRAQLSSHWLTYQDSRTDLLLVIHDLSEVRQLEGARRDLVANVSHELKTPIGAIRVLAETLSSDASPDPALVTDFLSRIVRETERLATLVEEMMYLSRLESAQEPLALADADLGEIVGCVIHSLTPLAEAKRIAVTVQSNTEAAVRCDPRRIGRAVNALLDNAIKFSSAAGEIRVAVQSLPGMVKVTITDQGPGIAQADLARVYERFFKAEPSRQGPGSGLGLAIVKHIIQAHGGRIFAHSSPGQGSTFGFELPRGGPSPATGA